MPNTPPAPVRLTPGFIRTYLRSRGIREDVPVHEQDYRQFLRDQGVKELGRGGEGAVYFLRGHVVKLVAPELAQAALREVVHMLHLNRTVDQQGFGEAAMGERLRQDWPSLLWIYTLSNGSLSIGMRPFDQSEDKTGATLFDRIVAGPPLPRAQALRAIRMIARSLEFAQRRSIVHFDLKPANVFIPGDPKQDPVVFDLGQALWQQQSWGADWLRHAHNLTHWYNGTYRYMHYVRRLAHLAALAVSAGERPNPTQAAAFKRFVPGYYDDVFAFAYMIRDMVRSPLVGFTGKDQIALTAFYRGVMGFRPRPEHTHFRSALMAKVTTMVQRKPAVPPLPPLHTETLAALRPRLEAVLDRLG